MDSVRDPYELDRLANELAQRESSDEPERPLPLLAPLSHEHPHLSSSNPTFDAETFLLSRPHTSLQDLRTELREYLATLKEELVQLINDDYAAFISLSTDLRDEGTRLERIKAPLGGVREEFEKSCADLRQVQTAVQDKLTERASLREEKALLHLLLKLSDSTSRLESLLLIASPEEAVTDVPNGIQGLSLGGKLNTEEDDKSRGGRAKHLTRVATEYMQLLYNADKARSEKCEFVNQLQPRIDRIKTTLSRDLDNLFSTTLTSLTSTTDVSATDKARWAGDLTECFKAYEILGGWHEAEEVVRRDLVRPFVKKTIFSGALAVPHSPVLPRTPLPDKHSNRPLSPTTPYTPFTSGLAGRKNPFDAQLFTDSTNSRLPLLDDSDNNLAALYNKLLRFVEKNCRGLIEIADSVSRPLQHGTAKPLPPRLGHDLDGPDGKEVDVPQPRGFDIMANVVWAEIADGIMEELGTVVFSAGRPDDFKLNYTTTHAFLTALEFLAPSLHSVETMRAHPTYATFEKRWQLPVYFQLRWKEIVGSLEGVLGAEITIASDPFVTPQAAATLQAIQRCWSSEVYLPELGHRFWRLSLQILSRYKTFVVETQPSRTSSMKESASRDELPRPSTPVQSTENTEDTLADDAALKQLASAIMDLKGLEQLLLELWDPQIKLLLPEELDWDEDGSIEATYRASIDALAAIIPELAAQIVAILTRRCADVVVQVRQIPSQLRSMSQKREPTEPSHFVPAIMKPVRLFFARGGAGHSLKDEFASAWATEVFESVSARYVSYLTQMKKSEESLRRLRKGTFRSPLSLFGSSGPSQNEALKDEERVRLQMILDVEAFAKDVRVLGVKVDGSPSYATLKTIASQSDGP